ncbi:hypothetical protein B0T13DRAFT_501448 [Neurospora crassa]|nr:hypothetical protein B0T13DRAFT_501448 [Neurospora crassa]
MAEPHNTPMPASTPVPASTPRSSSPAPPLPSLAPNASISTVSRRMPQQDSNDGRRLIVLHIDDPIKYNLATYTEFSQAFEGDFSAIFRPFWGTGGEMGRWDADLISLLPISVKVFASAGAGFDWADTKFLGERGIVYCNSGPAAAEAVADFAVAMVISTFRHLPWCMGAATLPYFLSTPSSPDFTTASVASIASKTFQACHSLATAVSHNPRNHVLGIIGLGNIGQQIAAKLGSAFGMRIAYYDIVRKPAPLESSLGAIYHSSLEKLLAISDCVVLCTPASADGKPIITTDVLKHIKKGSRFVNVARGSLVDEDAGGTVETHIGFEELSMRNIMAVLGGQKAITPVNMHYLKDTE